LKISFSLADSYSQKDIKFDLTEDYEIKGSNSIESMVSEISKVCAKELLDYCQEDFTLKVFSKIHKNN
tara:strand:+ start:169 stop:372 length:204 start_codon:yes stop_codon:yes gene_type:complete